MRRPKRPKAAATERAGVAFVRAVVERQNSIFHEIHHENDYGNDAFIELVDGEEATGICVGVQIKSGRSYCSRSSCRIPYTEKQATYWRNHSLRVLGIVYDPTEKAAYWIDLVARCRRAIGAGVATFSKSDFRRFDDEHFTHLVLPLLLRKRPHLAFDVACEYALSNEFEAHSLGLRALLHDYPNCPETWRIFHRLLLDRSVDELNDFIAYALAHIPWHGDIALIGSPIDEELRSQVRAEMAKWGRDEIVKLLGLMDEFGVERGSTGQSVYAIVDLCVDEADKKLVEIAFDQSLTPKVRQNALYLLGFIMQRSVTPILKRAVEDPHLGKLSEHMQVHLREVGFFAV